MPRKAAELGALAVSRLIKPGTHAVGGVAGLKLKINDAGAGSWVLRATVAGKIPAGDDSDWACADPLK